MRLGLAFYYSKSIQHGAIPYHFQIAPDSFSKEKKLAM